MNKLLPARKAEVFIPAPGRNIPYRPARQEPPVRSNARPGPQKSALSKESMLFMSLILLIIIIGVGLIGMYGRVVAINYQIQQVNSEIAQLLEEQEYLTIEVKKLASLERIENIAINELGLQYPETRQWLLLSAREMIGENTR